MWLAETLKDRFDLSLSAPMPDGAALDANEMAASEMIPYTVPYDDETIITRDNGLVQVVKIDGLYFESLSAEQIKSFERRRNTVLRSIAQSDIGIYTHLIRRKVQSYPEGEGGAWFARKFNAAWRAHCEANEFFANEIYISVVCNRFRQGVPGIMDWVGSLFFSKNEQTEAELFEQQSIKINEATDLLVKSLSVYGARKLRIQRLPEFEKEQICQRAARSALERFKLSWDRFEREYSTLRQAQGSDGRTYQYESEAVLDHLGPDFSEIGSFFHYLVNLEEARVPVSDLPLAQTLAASSLDFKTVGNMMAVQGLTGARAAAMLSMGEWPARTPSRMLDAFLRAPVEFVITQSFFFLDRASAQDALATEGRRLKVNDKDGVSDLDREDIKKGLQSLTRNESVNGLHHLTMLVHVPAVTKFEQPSDNRRQTALDLDAAVGILKAAFVNLNVKPVREGFGLETFFWSQLPGQAQHFIGRRGKIKSSNFAGFASLHAFAGGKRDGNLWGPAIMVLPTESGTAYHFNWHREIEGMVAGHALIAADTGSGKTTLLSALVAMSDKAMPRVFWFDNRAGAEVFMRAMGGQHTTLTVQGSTGWNPLKLPDTHSNRAFLVDLLTLMRTCYGGEIVPDDIERFQKTVIENYALPVTDRRLRNVAWTFGQGQLGKDMRVWHGDGANAGVFDNEHDNIDLARRRHYCYEMRELIKDGVARPELAVVLSYPFHRIEQAMNGEPFIIVLEEGQNLVKNAFWREKIDSYLMQIRRKNGILIFVTPDAKYAYAYTDSIAKQTATKLYLPHADANREDLERLGVPESGISFLRDTPPEQRMFLIVRGQEMVKARFDLSDMPEFIPVLSSNDKGVALMHEIMAELNTDDPEEWVPVLMERAQSRNTHNLKRG